MVCTRCSAGWEVERRRGQDVSTYRAPTCPLCGRSADVESRGERVAVSVR